ncbi:PAAR domain-containing protein (plasmid) [Paraburkholderia strydomiana]
MREATPMRKALVVQGSPTTTGGVVTGGSATHMTDHGRPFALHGDKATCGKCKGAFRISGTATRRCYRGKPGVVEGDLVLCPCGQNRVMASPNPGCFYWTDESTAGVSSEAAAAIASSVVNAIYDEQVRAAAAGMTIRRVSVCHRDARRPDARGTPRCGWTATSHSHRRESRRLHSVLGR